MGLLPCVYSLGSDEAIAGAEGFPTLLTLVEFLSSVALLMFIQA